MTRLVCPFDSGHVQVVMVPVRVGRNHQQASGTLDSLLLLVPGYPLPSDGSPVPVLTHVITRVTMIVIVITIIIIIMMICTHHDFVCFCPHASVGMVSVLCMCHLVIKTETKLEGAA
jgi:hypothetical protein